MPIPLKSEFLGPIEIRTKQRSNLKVGFVGSTRAEKGFTEIWKIYEQLGKKIRDDHKIHCSFVIQINEVFDVELLGHVERFKRESVNPKNNFTSVEIIEGPLATDEYVSLLKSLDVVLLPYTSSKYSKSSSGVVPEALAMGLPFICLNGLWPAKQLDVAKKSGYDVGVVANSLDDFAECIIQISENYEDYADSCFAYSEHIKSLHNADRLIEEIWSKF